MPILYLDKENPQNIILKLDNYHNILFSGFDSQFSELANWANKTHKKVIVFWHFSVSMEVDTDLGRAWNSLLPLLYNKQVDLFITCKYGLAEIIEKIFNVKSFFILNNSFSCSYQSEPKNGIGLFSGSGNYWVKNFKPNFYAALLTDKKIDIVPYNDNIHSILKAIGMENRVTGTGMLNHEAFLRRLSSSELVSYVTFSERSPILPLEALNNGVICLTGNNHHYFRTEPRLSELLICNRPDDPLSIYNCITTALDNKEEILELYKKWKNNYNSQQEENFQRLIHILESL